jgi:hypothetical protein
MKLVIPAFHPAQGRTVSLWYSCLCISLHELSFVGGRDFDGARRFGLFQYIGSAHFATPLFHFSATQYCTYTIYKYVSVRVRLH